jgi:integrase
MHVTEEDLSAWVNKDDGTKASTRGIRIAALRSFFGWCANKDYLSPDPSRTIRIRMKNLTHEQKETRKQVPFTDAEVDKLSDYLMSEICLISTSRNKSKAMLKRLPKLKLWYSLVLIGRCTGLRLGDICSLEWKCFDKVAMTMTVWTDKSDQRVVLPITEQLERALGTIPQTTPPNSSSYCFPNQRKAVTNPAMRHLLAMDFSRILKGAGLVGHTFHELRHSKATELYLSGMSLDKIAKYLGHSKSSTEVTQGYLHPEFKGIGPATPAEATGPA